MAWFNSRTKEYSAVLILFLLSLTILQKANSLEYEMRNSDSDVDEDKVMKREEGTRTTVIRHERCLSCLTEEEREVAEESKETLEKVHTFAELEQDHRASLPPCSFSWDGVLHAVLPKPREQISLCNQPAAMGESSYLVEQENPT